jgi:stringent starvation protein B
MTTETPLTSRRPYLLRAMHEWMTDNGQTPHLVVDATFAGVVVPGQYVRDGKIVLNVAYGATSGLLIHNDGIGFSARFGGVAFEVFLPVQAVLGIYARETGQGMIFSDDDAVPPPPSPPGSEKPMGAATGGDEPKRARLTVVK